MSYSYRDKNDKLIFKSDKEIRIQGAVYIAIRLIISLILVFIFKY